MRVLAPLGLVTLVLREASSTCPECVQCVPSALRLFCVGSAPFALDVDHFDYILLACSLFALHVAFLRCMCPIYVVCGPFALYVAFLHCMFPVCVACSPIALQKAWSTMLGPEKWSERYQFVHLRAFHASREPDELTWACFCASRGWACNIFPIPQAAKWREHRVPKCQTGRLPDDFG